MKKLSISVLLLFVFFSGTVLVGQTGPSDTGSDPSHQALSWMVDEVAGMLVRELGGDGPAADIHVRGITMQDTPVLLGDYLAASLPVRMSRRSGHSISVYSRPGAGFYSISGKVFRIGDALDLFITLHDQDGRVVTGKELRLPLSPGLEELLVPANYGGGGDLYEPDSGSSPLVLSPGDVLDDRTLDPEGDRDWFAFTLPENAEPSILTVQSTGDLDTYIEVYRNGDLTDPVLENDDSDDQNARVSVDIAPGETIVIALRGYDDSETGSYKLISRFEEFGPDASEPNNRMEDALSLEIGGGEESFHIFPSGDLDWYRIQVPRTREEAYLNIETGGDLDTFMELYSADGDLLVSDDDGGGDVQARIAYGPVHGSETFFVKVRHYEQGGTGAYSLSADFFEPAYDEYEPDNGWEEASELELPGSGDTLSRNYLFSTPGDSDWVRFTLQKGQRLILRTEGAADTYLTLYDENRRILQESDDDGEEYNGRIEYSLAPGTYRLETRQYQEDAREGVDYRLLITAE
ncbi:pre-peptidase C-terminal domain-containing protein [Marispirochaeta aestuarii]|uniref:pre-peptidase C-terminal domain-containing protein n=1 Tax=Marispirochaeta aestuarii TaxID=1963862 RepID=UPI0011788432|nr:pre-peptidase C-terminal domain-containing protein [Marispirochaeta aestuarii]